MIFYKLFLVFFFSFFHLSSSEGVAPRCNVNDECPLGFVCLGGDPNQIDIYTGLTALVNDSYGNLVPAAYKGYCTATVPMRQACYLHGLITGKFGRAVVVLVLISLGFLFVTDKIDKKQLLSLFLGVTFLFGSFQIIYFLTGTQEKSCEIIDLTAKLGIPIEVKPAV